MNRTVSYKNTEEQDWSSSQTDVKVSLLSVNWTCLHYQNHQPSYNRNNNYGTTNKQEFPDSISANIPNNVSVKCSQTENKQLVDDNGIWSSVLTAFKSSLTLTFLSHSTHSCMFMWILDLCSSVQQHELHANSNLFSFEQFISIFCG